MRLVRVAVPVPALDSLTYSLPDHFQTPVVGARVLVPLGSRVLTGCVVESVDVAEPPAAAIKPVIEVLDAEAYLPADVVGLATWVAEYCACGIGSALATAMPPMAAASEPGGPARGFRTVRVAALTVQGLEAAGDRGSAMRWGRASVRRSRSSLARRMGSRPRASRRAASARRHSLAWPRSGS